VSFYRVYPDPRIAIDPDTKEDVHTLTEWYRPLGDQSVRINMITTPAGETAGTDGTSGSLSSGHDRLVLRAIRRHADAVIIGAATLRRERIPLPDSAPLIVVTHSGDVNFANVVNSNTSSQLVVLTDNGGTVPTAPDSLAVDVIPHRDGLLTPEAIVAFCADQGWSHLLVEGGQNLVTQFAIDGLVDELCLTLTGPPHSDSSPPLSWWPDTTAWTTVHLLTDDHRMLYHRFQRPDHSPS
jgi:5-amino-6-(5-phosphoribosylamino)uracil reductase